MSILHSMPKNTETPYQRTLAQAWSGTPKDSLVLERIVVKETGEECIRLAWWKNGNIIARPADLEAIEWPTLFANAVQQGVFSPAEELAMIKALLR